MKSNAIQKMTVVVALIVVASSGVRAAVPEHVHDKDYWREIIADDYAPPADVPLASLVAELSGYLGSPDAELRDGIGYAVLTQWLYVKKAVPPDLRRELIAEWMANLRQGIGEKGTDSVLKRSFSALMLSIVAALDNEELFLDRKEFDALLQAALAYLRDEKDTRGFNAEQGWLHSVAHTADLLKFLCRSRHLAASEQAAVLTAIARKMARLDHVLVHGEDERLARAVVSIVARPDVDMQALEEFLSALEPVRSEGFPGPQTLATNQNQRNLTVTLFAVLYTDTRDLESVRAAREHVLGLLRTTM